MEVAESGSVGSLMEVSTLSGEPSSSGDIDDPEYVIVDPQVFNSFPSPSHFAALMEALQGKAKEIDLFTVTHCMSNTHLRWVANKPDNINRETTTDDRAARDRIPSTTSKASSSPPKRKGQDWGKTSYIGIMLTGDPKTEPKYYVEIQLKRISGADKYELKNSGIDPNIIFAGLTKKFYSPSPAQPEVSNLRRLLGIISKPKRIHYSQLRRAIKTKEKAASSRTSTRGCSTRAPGLSKRTRSPSPAHAFAAPRMPP
jgi:hypothetical protein